MTRVLLVNPPSPERLGTPLLGQQYVAASFLARGCEVRVVDAASRYGRSDLEGIAAVADAFDPHLVGVGLFTRWVWHAYALVDALRGRGRLLVAGGAHATARPDEPLHHGFDVSVAGEAEHVVGPLVDAVEGRRDLVDVPGIRVRQPDGTVGVGPARRFVDDLDALAPPHTAQHLYDGAWYDADGGEVVPGGLLTSRGCPSRCTFCANYVTGRGFRFRSPEGVLEEIRAHHARWGAAFLPMWDDALTAHRPRLLELCRALEEGLDFPFTWSAITRANMVNGEVLDAMVRAGLVMVNFGVESGDDDILRAIKKGVRTDRVVRALELAKERGLRTACNFMVGFPQERPRHLENTLRFLERIAPLVDTFSTMGVAVPFPGTPLYEAHHEAHGFTDWWLDERYARYEAPPPISDFDRFYRHYIDDANLAHDFFDYDDATVEAMRAVLRYKGEHNLRRMGLLRDPVHAPEPSPEGRPAPRATPP